MKKLLFLSPLFLFLPAMTFAGQDFSCHQDILQPAVSPRGNCHVFDTRCQVPDDWKLVPSCEEVQDRNFGSRPEDVTARRTSQNYWDKYKARVEAEKAEEEKDRLYLSSYKKFGRASIGRAGRDRDPRGAVEDRNPRRATTQSYYGPSKSFALQDPRREQDAPDELENRATSRWRTRLAIGAGAVREGKLQARPKWTVEQRNRRERMEDKDMQGWKERMVEDRRVEEKPYEYEGLKLRRIWRPSFSGDLDRALIED